MDYSRLLNTRFYPGDGQFRFSNPNNDLVIFPPSDLDPRSADSAYEIRHVGGDLVAEHTVRTMDRTRSEAFLRVNTFSAAQWYGVLEDGESYTLSLVRNGEAFASLPFRVAVSDGGDPFDPKTIWTIDGLWRTHAYFEHETVRPDYQLYFNAWVAPDEVTVAAPVEVFIRRDGEDVAWGTTFVGPDGGWQKVRYQLLTPDSRGEDGRRLSRVTNWTVADVTPGTYEIVFMTGGQVVRSMTIEGAEGAFIPSPRSDMSADRATFLTPRSLLPDDSQTPVSLYWVVNE